MSPKSEIRTVFFIMVDHPLGPRRVGNAYSSRDRAKEWVAFVRKFHRLRTYIQRADLKFIDGQLDAASVELLDKVFNLDPPKAKTRVADEQAGQPS